MSQAGRENTGPCAGPCDRCSLAHEPGQDSGPAALAGWRMIMASAAVFLLPLAGAIAGAAWIRSGAIKQLLAVLAGFAAGAAAAAIITRWIKPRPKEIS